MSRFFVGQRVRVVKSGPRSRHLLGRETFVTEVGVTATMGRFGPFFDGLATTEKNSDGGQFVAPPDFFEPILPTGLESLDRINELYEPEPEAIRA